MPTTTDVRNLRINEQEEETNSSTFEIQINTITPETIKNFQEENAEPIEKSYHQLIFMTDGCATFYNNGEITNIDGDAVLLIAKNTPFFFIPNNDCKGWMIQFNEEFMTGKSPQLFMQLYRERFFTIQNEATRLKMKTLVKLMSTAMKSHFNNKNTFIGHLLAAFMTIINSNSDKTTGLKPGKNSRNANEFNRFMDLLENNFKSKNTVKFYANKLNISTRKLSHICNEITGKGTLQLIEERRIMEAKKLLMYSNSNAQQIAYQLGFQDHSYFTKVFKRHVNTTPLKFRKMADSME